MPKFTVTQAQIRINVVWFLSLAVSLTTVLVGILCLQWLREFQRDANLPHKDAVALRQMRYDGLTEWHVPSILSILPLLLQLSLVLFFVGLLDLLWSLNTFVAACVSAVVGMVMLFLIATTALPALQQALTSDKHLRVPQCPYKSPQSWLFYRTRRWLCVPLHLFLWRREPSRHEENFEPLFGDFFIYSWVAYDMRWRRFRAEDLPLDKPTTIRNSDDVVNGLHWINKTVANSVEAIYPVYHCLAELDIPTAVATISEIYLGLVTVDYAMYNAFRVHYDTFKAMMDDPSSLNEMQKRDIIAAYYLKLHQDKDPGLKIVYVEMVIRILNTRDVLKPFDDWLSEILRGLASKPLLAPSATTGAAAQSNTKVIIQIYLCVKSLITRDILPTDDAVMAWILLRQLLTPPPPPPPIDSEPPNLDHIKLAGGLFEALEGWLSRAEGTDRRERVEVCAEGMIRLFSASIDIAALHAVCPVQMAKAAGLVRALDVGGAAAVLARYRGWDSINDVRKWEFLVSRFKGIEGGGGHSIEITTP